MCNTQRGELHNFVQQPEAWAEPSALHGCDKSSTFCRTDGDSPLLHSAVYSHLKTHLHLVIDLDTL